MRRDAAQHLLVSAIVGTWRRRIAIAAVCRTEKDGVSAQDLDIADALKGQELGNSYPVASSSGRLLLH